MFRGRVRSLTNMSLPHTLYKCDRGPFDLASGPDRYDNGSQMLWGRLCACATCGELHLIAQACGADAHSHMLYARDFSRAGRHLPWPGWLATEQTCELLPWFATGQERRAELVDTTRVTCVACGAPELKLWLYHGMACPRCKDGLLLESFTG